MKLNRLQRHTAYIIMLAEFETRRPFFGLCYMANYLFGLGNNTGGNTDWSYNLKYFPEYRKRKPKGQIPSTTWFHPDDESVTKRINILEKCIKETA